MAAAMLFSLHKNPFRNRSVTVLTHYFDLKEETPVEKNVKKTCINTEQPQESGMKDLEIWVRGMHKQGDLSRKAAAAVDLALMIWYALSDEQRAELLKRDSIKHQVQQLIGYGYSWSV